MKEEPELIPVGVKERWGEKLIMRRINCVICVLLGLPCLLLTTVRRFLLAKIKTPHQKFADN